MFNSTEYQISTSHNNYVQRLVYVSLHYSYKPDFT